MEGRDTGKSPCLTGAPKRGLGLPRLKLLATVAVAGAKHETACWLSHLASSSSSSSVVVAVVVAFVPPPASPPLFRRRQHHMQDNMQAAVTQTPSQLQRFDALFPSSRACSRPHIHCVHWWNVWRRHLGRVPTHYSSTAGARSLLGF
jgi:hypothetical protein